MSLSRWCALSALIFLALAPVASASKAQVPSLEHSIKATFLYKFAPFVQWPSSAFASPTAPISVCLLGTDPVTEALEQLTITERVGERAYQIRRLDRIDRDSACHILYVAASRAPTVARAFESIGAAPVLTVVDSAANLQSAIITFVIDQNRIRFDIDDAAAAERGLTISSRLLSLARTVRQRP